MTETAGRGLKAAIAKTLDGRYLFAIYGAHGFAAYHVFKATPYFQGKIRKLAYQYGAEIPNAIKWDELPKGNAIEKYDGEEEARIRA